MEGRIASVLVATALVVGAGIGYFGSTASSHTVTETLARTHTTTLLQIRNYTVTLPQESGVLRCVVTHYSVWMVGYVQTSTTSFGTATQTFDLRTYSTTTSVSQTVGFATVTTSSSAGTITGAIAEGIYTTCTYVPG